MRIKFSSDRTSYIHRKRHRPTINKLRHENLKRLTAALTFSVQWNAFINKTQPGTPRHRRTRVPLLSSDPGGVHPFVLHGTRLRFYGAFKHSGCQTETRMLRQSHVCVFNDWLRVLLFFANHNGAESRSNGLLKCIFRILPQTTLLKMFPRLKSCQKTSFFVP